MDLYREEILEHWQNPQNFGVIGNADLVIYQVNPLCGDEVTFYFRFSVLGYRLSDDSLSVSQLSDKLKTGKPKSEDRKQRTDNRKILDVSFTGSGCAISTASASILSEKIKGKTIEEISKITGEDIFEMLGGPVSPARLKCAFLPLEAIKKVVGAK